MQLASFFNIVANTPNELEEMVLEIFPEIKLSISWDYGIKHLKGLYNLCEGLRISTNALVLDAALMPDENFIYHAGLFFNVITHMEPKENGKTSGEHIAASGGRFDNVLHFYSMPKRP